MMRDVLVHVDGSDPARRRVRFAVDLAARVGACLTGLHVTPPAEVPPRFKPSLIAEVTADLAAHLAREARAAARIFSEEAGFREGAARGRDGPFWLESAGDVVQEIATRARCADIVIVGQYEWQGPPEAHPLPIAHGVVVRCGRPVLVVPAAAPPSTLARVIVAWDGSREAVRAVHDALPLMRLARSVQIVTMISPTAGDDEIDTASLSAHLARHQIQVATDVVHVRSAQEHESLRERITRGECDLLVMGGYSHPIWLEFIFGGATRSILLSSNIPVLVSH